MKKTIYYMYKPGEERDFALPRQPDPHWAQAQMRSGYVLLSVEIDLPDTVTANITTSRVLPVNIGS